MNSKLSNLLTNDSPAPVLLSNGILLHNKIDLDALGLSSYKKHFNAKEFSKLKESTEPSQPPSSALKKLTQPTESYDSSDPSEISASLDQTVSSEPTELIETKIISPAPQISKPFGGSEENSVNTFFDFHKADAPKDFSWMVIEKKLFICDIKVFIYLF